MSIIKSFSVGNGDMFYIDHNSENFTIIDCNLIDDDTKSGIISEIADRLDEKDNYIIRFISTHPDEDHIHGLKDLMDKISIPNFYCVKNEATKKESTTDFNFYCLQRNGNGHYYVSKGCKRKWMNQGDSTRGAAGINFLWPVTNNEDYQEALSEAKEGVAYNNISPVFTYKVEDGITALWMGDMEHDFTEKVGSHINWPAVDVLFAPHHGRKSGKVPSEILQKLDPQIIVIGEANSCHLDYYQGYHTITQNSAGDIIFVNENDKIHIYTSNEYKPQDTSYLSKENLNDDDNKSLGFYLGSLKVRS